MITQEAKKAKIQLNTAVPKELADRYQRVVKEMHIPLNRIVVRALDLSIDFFEAEIEHQNEYKKSIEKKLGKK